MNYLLCVINLGVLPPNVLAFLWYQNFLNLLRLFQYASISWWINNALIKDALSVIFLFQYYFLYILVFYSVSILLLSNLYQQQQFLFYTTLYYFGSSISNFCQYLSVYISYLCFPAKSYFTCLTLAPKILFCYEIFYILFICFS